MATVSDMTLEELKQLIDESVNERLLELWGRDTQQRSWDEVRASIKRNRWTPPVGTPSAVELLREDRDR